MDEDRDRPAEIFPDKAALLQRPCRGGRLREQLVISGGAFADITHFAVVAGGRVFVPDVLHTVFVVPRKERFHALVVLIGADDRRFILPPEGIIPSLFRQRARTGAVAFRIVTHAELRHIGASSVFLRRIGGYKKRDRINALLVPRGQNAAQLCLKVCL